MHVKQRKEWLSLDKQASPNMKQDIVRIVGLGRDYQIWIAWTEPNGTLYVLQLERLNTVIQ